jgi:membrane associated rhomboid family serine protease
VFRADKNATSKRIQYASLSVLEIIVICFQRVQIGTTKTQEKLFQMCEHIGCNLRLQSNGMEYWRIITCWFLDK